MLFLKKSKQSFHNLLPIRINFLILVFFSSFVLSITNKPVNAVSCQEVIDMNRQRMERIVSRAGRIINRSESRYNNLIQYLDSKHIVVPELNDSRADIESRLKQAKDYYAQVQSKAENFNCEQNPKESIQDFISNIDQLKRSLKELKLILIKVFLASKSQVS